MELPLSPRGDFNFIPSKGHPVEELQLQSVLESVPNGVIVTDSAGIIRLCNAEIERMFGYDMDELLGRRVESLVPHQFRDHHPQFWSEFIKQPTSKQAGAARSLVGIRKDGVEIPVEIGLSHLQTENGIRVIAAIVDATERKKAEKKLHEAYFEVQKKNEELEQFVYTVSHDLKSPLISSLGFLKFLREDMEKRNFAGMENSLDRLERVHHRMQELIDDLLTLSQMQRLELDLEWTSLQEVLDGVLEYIGDSLKKNNIQLLIPSDLPEIQVDRKRIHQVFENLLVNAIKYGSDGPSPQIQVLWRDHLDRTLVCIKDSGRGIERQYHEKIFGLFKRLQSDQPGAGVGLAIVTRIMQLHQGRVWVESELGRGSEFWLSFPKGKDEGFFKSMHIKKQSKGIS